MSSLRETIAGLPGATFADLLASDGAYLVVIDLPGATAETTDVRFENGRLTIDARREKDTPGGYRYEREERSVFLDATLPVPPDGVGDEATASIENGVLELRIPKRSAVADSIPIE